MAPPGPVGPMALCTITLSEVLGREQVREALQWYDDQPYRPDLWWKRRNLRWLLSGAPATPADRLRWISRNPIRA
ncbi:hypothetical protein E0H73_33290 [Kribbella pittospori]|uniref:Uncharacterized protein n=1 Tax=Kribbella pittospori TaxID=722689 RepID=A0A4R0K9Z1_9ACTN|nr:hypothetical protein [Kribbella pittospori]TCC56549.1 hypothetical protein E0H73_33290 [Kribbella pittospori]